MSQAQRVATFFVSTLVIIALGGFFILLSSGEIAGAVVFGTMFIMFVALFAWTRIRVWKK